MAFPGFPERIVCLTEETTETLYRLGEGDRVVGISGYTVRPPEARSKPKVSAFINARFDKIEALRPDLVLAFSDLQANITAVAVDPGRKALAPGAAVLGSLSSSSIRFAALIWFSGGKGELSSSWRGS